MVVAGPDSDDGGSRWREVLRLCCRFAQLEDDGGAAAAVAGAWREDGALQFVVQICDGHGGARHCATPI